MKKYVNMYIKEYMKIVIFSALLVFLGSVNVYAETKEQTIEIPDDKYENAVFYISWDNYEKESSVEMVSPDGTIYNSSNTPDNVYEDKGEAIVRIGKAKGGTWTVKITGDELGTIDISVGQLPNSIVIEEFTVSESDGKYIAEYKASDCPEEVYIEVFADTDNEGYDGVNVYGGYGGVEGRLELNMDNLETAEYNFYIRISKDGIYKREYADEIISYVSPYDTESDETKTDTDADIDASIDYDVEENITSQKFIMATVTMNSDCHFDAYINGDIKIENEEESGEYKINMNDGDNEIIFIVTDSNGNTKEFVKEIYVDTVAPTLSVSKDINNVITTKNYIYLSGYSEASATLLLNGKEVDMENGYFNKKVELSLGENNIELVAKDIAGNETVYTAVVKYELSKTSRMELYVILALAVLLSVLYIVIFVKGVKRRKK